MSPEYEAGFDASGRLLAEERAGDNAPPLSVSELSAILKRTVEDRFGYVRLRGEISGFKRAASGHLYLCLKDDNAVIDGVMWKGGAARLPFAPQDGVEVIATGKLTTYPGRSKYQIVIERMELAGEGALMALLEKLKQKLAAEGLFDRDRKRRLPFMPRTIGVVTSPTGAVIRDILHRLEDRCPTNVLLWPVLVQGQGAAEQVARAVRGFSDMKAGGPHPRPDLVIVARGGGSIEDLWSFNEETVVRAVAECSIPIISAVGHETDTTLCDHAADMRAPTPTAAAEMAVPVRADLIAMLTEQGLRMNRAVRRGAAQARERLDMQARLMPTPDTLLAPQRQRLDQLSDNLGNCLRHRLADARGHLGQAGGALRPALLQQYLNRAKERLDRLRLRPDYLTRVFHDRATAFDRLSRLFVSVNPDLPLQRGFARVMAGDRLVKTTADARAAGAVSLHFADGAVGAVIEGGSPPTPLEKPPSQAISPSSRPARKPQESGETRQQDLFS
ncbi:MULTISPECIES: exodeoxyribonuclease VII large subunit [Sphingobium]|uniref:Exodeoxyribonuclease 7 large subunit n=1 Tax=Sphingobium tyrosinilyticum TaxID=2715436 RepID=A0ABV9F4S7_9SPHN|nr:exodeoxyribonuclease VII large subunit [Sphingobium sp. EP60837]ANI77962.1 Exodeoxyribonuclease VII [Sphingobium sp. EP60837]